MHDVPGEVRVIDAFDAVETESGSASRQTADAVRALREEGKFISARYGAGWIAQ